MSFLAAAVMTLISSLARAHPSAFLWTASIIAAGLASFYGIGGLRRYKRARADRRVALDVPSSLAADAPAPEALSPPAPGLADGRRHPLYRAARAMLFLLSAWLFVVSLGGVARHADTLFYLGEMQLPSSDRDVEQTVIAEVAKAIATLGFDSIILHALAEEDIHRAEIYMGVARRIGFPLRADTVERFEDATDGWSSALRVVEGCANGAFTGKVDDLASFGCGLASDLSGLGDLRDIGIHGSAYLSDRPYDDFILGLSIFGLGITFLEPSQTLNAGAAMLKGASRLRRVSQPLQRQLRRLVGDTVDLGAAKAMLRRPTSEAAAKVIRRQGISGLRHAADQAGTIYHAGGRRALVMALRHADNVDELSLFARVAWVMGKQADEVIEIAGKGLKTAFRVSKVSARAATFTVGWAAALAAAVIGLLTSLSEVVARRIGTGVALRCLAAYLARRQVSQR